MASWVWESIQTTLRPTEFKICFVQPSRQLAPTKNYFVFSRNCGSVRVSPLFNLPLKKIFFLLFFSSPSLPNNILPHNFFLSLTTKFYLRVSHKSAPPVIVYFLHRLPLCPPPWYMSNNPLSLMLGVLVMLWQIVPHNISAWPRYSKHAHISLQMTTIVPRVWWWNFPAWCHKS